MTSTNSIDPREFRNALGEFTTGVTIITTTDANGAPSGVTVNSFASVSLEPPLVLWSLGKESRSFSAFMEKRDFVIHVLGQEQETMSNRFASKDDDKFAELEYETNESGAPLLPGCIARFECQVHQTLEGGDHIIFIGQVNKMDHNSAEPLVFHRGGYTKLPSS